MSYRNDLINAALPIAREALDGMRDMFRDEPLGTDEYLSAILLDLFDEGYLQAPPQVQQQRPSPLLDVDAKAAQRLLDAIQDDGR